MRFSGSIDAKVDEKGRGFGPSNFRKILQREEVEGLILRRDIFQDCLVLYPADIWNQQVDAIAARTNMFSREGRHSLRKFVAGAEHVAMDGGGRILIPKRYLEEAGIRSEVRFIGMDNTIEIWSKQAAEALLCDAGTLGDALDAMMNGTQKGNELF